MGYSLSLIRILQRHLEAYESKRTRKSVESAYDEHDYLGRMHKICFDYELEDAEEKVSPSVFFYALKLSLAELIYQLQILIQLRWSALAEDETLSLIELLLSCGQRKRAPPVLAF